MYLRGIKKRLISTYLVFLLLTLGFVSVLVFEGIMDMDNIAKAETIYVDPGGSGHYTTIQGAIDNAQTGDTIIVANGTYFESVTINKPNIVLIGNSTADCKIIHHYAGTNINTDYAAGINVTASGVNITGFQISVSGSYTLGIRIKTSSSSNSSIINNKIITSSRSGHGIFLSQASNNNNLSNNIIKTSGYYSHGFHLQQASNNILTNNTITTTGSSGDGFNLNRYSNNNILIGNIIHTSGEWSAGIYLSQAEYNNLTANTIHTDQKGSRGISVTWSSNNNNMSANTIHTAGQNGYSIFLQSVSNTNMINNTLNVTGRNGFGMFFDTSSNLYVLKNRINTTKEGYGIKFYHSKWATLSKNLMTICCIMISGNSLDYWNTHTIDNLNMVNNKPVYYYKDTSRKVVPGNAGLVILANCKYMSVLNQSLNYSGVLLGFTKYTLRIIQLTTATFISFRPEITI